MKRDSAMYTMFRAHREHVDEVLANTYSLWLAGSVVGFFSSYFSGENEYRVAEQPSLRICVCVEERVAINKLVSESGINLNEKRKEQYQHYTQTHSHTNAHA